MSAARAFAPLFVAMSLSLAACVSIPDTYAPPIERRPVTGYEANTIRSVVYMNDASAQAYILRDVSPTLEAGAWRWAFQRPELRFVLVRTEGVKLVMDFAIADATFKQTGPVTLSFFVNGQLLDKVRYDEPGNKHFEKPVPSEWLHAGEMNIMAAEIDKLYVSPQGGGKLGFILSRAGFIE